MRKAALVVVILTLCSSAYCGTITLDANGTGDYPTIQAAVNDANHDDTIILLPGSYTGDGNRDIDYLGKAITIRSTDPNDPCTVAATVIDCNGSETERHRGFILKRRRFCGIISCVSSG